MNCSNMVLMFGVIILILQALLTSGGNLSSSLNGKNIACGAVGEPLQIKWKTEFTNGELQVQFLVCLDEAQVNDCIATGDKDSFSKKTGTKYTDRIETTYVEGEYILIIKNLSKADEGSIFYVGALFKKSGLDQNPTIARDNVTISVKAYPTLLQPLNSSLSFNESDTPTVEIIASGIPRPSVTWKFYNFGNNEGSYTNESNDKYSYKYTLPKLTKNVCGYKLDYTISGWNNSVITKTSTVIVKFQPEITSLSWTRPSAIAVAVKWGEGSYGNCSVVYTVQVLNGSEYVLKSKTTTQLSTTFNFDSEAKSKSARKGRVEASFHGKKVVKEVNITEALIPTGITTNTTKTPPGESSSSNIALIIGIVVGVIVITIIIVVIVIYLKRKNKNNSLSAIGSSQGTENSYNHVPLDRRDGAEENNYTSVPSSKPPSRADDPDQMLYAELGAGGGRTGPKPVPEQSNYAVVKVDEMGYPARGPTSDKKSQPTYAAVNRDKSRRHSPPPPDDDNEGVIV